MSKVTIDGKVTEADVIITTQGQPIPPVVCPVGTHWDGTKCVPDVIPPIPPTPGDAIPLYWNEIKPVQGVPQGSTIVYVLNNQDVNKQSGIITVYTIALSTNVTCTLTHPNGAVQGPYNATYGLSVKFRLYYPIATGPYILRIYGNESGSIQVRAI